MKGDIDFSRNVICTYDQNGDVKTLWAPWDLSPCQPTEVLQDYLGTVEELSKDADATFLCDLEKIKVMIQKALTEDQESIPRQNKRSVSRRQARARYGLYREGVAGWPAR